MAIQAQTSQGDTRSTVAFSSFQPAIVTMANGKTITVRQANIFLKNGRLLFKRGTTNMEASMQDIVAVDFPGRHYVKVDTTLAYVVDTVGSAKLLCSTVIDMESYMAKLRNNHEVSNLQIGDMVSVNTVELDPDDNKIFPVVSYYYYDLNGKIFRAEERTITRHISKSKRTMMERVMAMPDFSWGSTESLMKLLEAIQ